MRCSAVLCSASSLTNRKESADRRHMADDSLATFEPRRSEEREREKEAAKERNKLEQEAQNEAKTKQKTNRNKHETKTDPSLLTNTSIGKHERQLSE